MAVALHPPWHFRRQGTTALERRRRRRVRTRSAVVTVARVRLGSVVRFAVFFFVDAAALLVLLAIGLWHVAVRAGTVAWFEELMVDLGFDTFAIDPDKALRVVLVGAGAFVVVGTLVALVAAVLFNLVNRVTGGIELAIREQSPEPRADDRRIDR